MPFLPAYTNAMAIPQRRSQTGTFFVTTICHHRRRLFQATRNAELLIETLQHYRAAGNYKLHAFVVMPDHVHLLLTPQEKTVSQAMNLIKGGFSHRTESKFPVWQRGFADHLVRNSEEFESRRLYIHQNPVRAHLADLPARYPHSSAYCP
jgi:putative transposase